MRSQIRRSRDGCWTCRKRKKKCDGERPICHNCERLKVHCQGYSPKILWEDDDPRAGMRRRGPAKEKSPKIVQERANVLPWIIEPQIMKFEEVYGLAEIISPRLALSEETKDLSFNDDDIHASVGSHGIFGLGAETYPGPRIAVCVDDLLPSSPVRFISPHPLGLTPLQSLFLDHYLNNFSLKYPTYLDPSNPFLSTLVPLALRNRTVLCAVLAIGGIQTGLGHRLDVKAEILDLKGRTLRGCRKLLHGSDALNDMGSCGKPLALKVADLSRDICHKGAENRIFNQRGEEDDLMLFASVMLLMVHDKLSGEPYSNLKPHLQFGHYFEQITNLHSLVSVHYKFLRNIFLYNDLLASISSGSPTLRDYGQDTRHSLSSTLHHSDRSLSRDESSMIKLVSHRYYLPILLSRIANGSPGITLADIERWDGNMTWLPSFSSTQIAEAVQTVERQPFSTAIADECEDRLISEIYRNAARILYLQRLRKDSRPVGEEVAFLSSSSLRSYNFQIQNFNSILLANLRLLPLGSAYESCLLFPIGIAAIDIHDLGEKSYVLSRLQLLEDRFQLDHFRKFREKLSAFWEGSETRFAGQLLACDAILLG